MDEFYNEYVQARREKVEKEEQEKPKAVTCHATVDRDALEGVVDLIGRHINQYGLTSQGLLLRAAKAFEDALQK